jgi:hypothetical protein
MLYTIVMTLEKTPNFDKLEPIIWTNEVWAIKNLILFTQKSNPKILWGILDGIKLHLINFLTSKKIIDGEYWNFDQNRIIRHTESLEFYRANMRNLIINVLWQEKEISEETEILKDELNKALIMN